MIKIKRVYDPAEDSDGQRVLVDRLWPRGLTKSAVKMNLWMKEIAPSTSLRQWYSHDPAKWDEFRKRYANELDQKPTEVNQLLNISKESNLTLLYGSKEKEINNAAALKEYLERKR
jgi:uncharacterized protein YeaO (DUF488 family)